MQSRFAIQNLIKQTKGEKSWDLYTLEKGFDNI